MFKRFAAVAVLLAFLNAQEAHAIDLAKVKFQVRKAIALPVYFTVGLVAGPVLGVIAWKSYYQTQANALKQAALIKANTVRPSEMKEAVKDAAK